MSIQPLPATIHDCSGRDMPGLGLVILNRAVWRMRSGNQHTASLLLLPCCTVCCPLVMVECQVEVGI